MYDSDMNTGLAEGLAQFEGIATPAEGAVTEEDILTVAKMFECKRNASKLRVEHKLGISSKKVDEIFSILISKGCFGDALEGNQYVYTVFTDRLRQFLDGDNVEDSVAPARIEERAPESAEEHHLPSAELDLQAPLAPCAPHVEVPIEVSAVRVKTKFSSPLAGLTGIHNPGKKPERKSNIDKLAQMLEDLDHLAVPGALKGEARDRAIRETTAKLESFVNQTNSAIKKMEFAGARVSPQEDRIFLRKYEPSADGSVLGGVKFLVKNRRGEYRLLWSVRWEENFSEAWLNQRLENAAERCKHHLASLGGFRLIRENGRV